MDNRQRLWSRLFSKLRWSHRRAGYSCAQQNSHTSGRKLWQLARCRSAPTTTLAAPSLEVNIIHGSRPSRSSENGIHFRFGGRLAERQEGFIPKCLSDMNTQTLLNGQGSIENFSRNCWLENRLHIFGQLPTALNPITESEFQVVTATDGDFNVPVSQVRLATFQRVLRSNQLMNSLLGESHPDQSSTSSQSASTISSNSNFPNLNLSISGFAFDPDASAVDPPPYSEFPDDPPPSYEESKLVEYRTQASGIQTNSNFLSNVDYLY